MRARFWKRCARETRFCEKPLALCQAELDEILRAGQTGCAAADGGVQPAFCAVCVRLKEFLSAANEPVAAHYRVNAGYIPASHWVHDPAVGGGG